MDQSVRAEATDSFCRTRTGTFATDTTRHFIVAHEVHNVGHDRTALAFMASKAQEGLGRKGIGLIADRSYYKGTEMFAC